MRGRRGLFSLFTSLPENTEDKLAPRDVTHRRRRHFSGGDRETWSRKVEYFFAALGYAVGLGNIWRFPYLCYRNGGGAFLIPYILALVAIGFPVLFMEMAFGQFASLGPITIWRICPIFKGIGFAIVVVLVLVNTYYNVLNAYALYFLFASITNQLPWAHCNNEWNTDKCINVRCDTVQNSDINITNATASPCYFNATVLNTPTEEYFEHHLLNMTTGIHDIGQIHWPLVVCLFVSWFTCFACLFKGIKSMGKAVVFTTIFSYLILTVLLIRGVTLPGSLDGIIFYLKPRFDKLAELKVWGEAFSQAVASLSLGGGGWITLSSYNRFNNKVHRDAIMIGVGNALTSLYAGFVIFSVLGYMAYIKGVDVADVTKIGPGLAFVAYPEGLAMIPGAPFWSICFFFMMFTVGLDSLFGQVETIVCAIVDEFPEQLRPRRKLITLGLCFMMFLLGIVLVSQGGIYIVTLMDWYVLLFSFSIISLFELIAVMYVYGYKSFCDDVKVMIGIKPSMYYIVCWLGITPVLLLCVIAFIAANYDPAHYGNYVFPPFAESIGWALALLPVSLVPIVMLIQCCRKVHTVKTLREVASNSASRREIMACLVSPTEEWGPALPADRRRYSSGGSYKRRQHSGDTQGTLDDDVFEGQEMKDMNDEKDRIVRFEDETNKSREGSTSTAENKAAEAGVVDGDVTKKEHSAPTEEEKLLDGKKEVKA